LTIGALITVAWPAKYLSQSKILISSQEIPTDLVRPTVATLSNERIQYIEQRIMTRDNLLAIAKKFNLSMGWQGRMSGTELVDFVRDRTLIKPLEASIQSDRKQAIAFTVGFAYEQPDIAMKVANEFVTMILNEDVRSRTNFASETTKFLEQDVKRLEDQLSSINVQISERGRSSGAVVTAESNSDDAKSIAALKAQLAIKSALYSDSHPDIRALKRQIEALEKAPAIPTVSAEAPQKASGDFANPPPAGGTGADQNPQGLDTLETRRASLRTQLTTATQKLASARLGESLERGQHSERLEVIEQATIPKNPISPNRPKIFAFVLAFAIMAGGGLLVGSEVLNPAIRRSSDLWSLVDSHLIVSIPQIFSHGEVRRKKRRFIVVASGLALLILIGLTVMYFLLPPLDVLFDKSMAALFR
jgi:capsule polysaccharide export protein KpsE/RkpR